MQAQAIKHEPPVEFVLILPRPTIGWPAIKKENDVKWWVKSVEVTKFDAKWRNETELFQTFLTRPCPKSKRWVKSVRLSKFNAKWQGRTKLFQTFLICPHCKLVMMKSQKNFTRHMRKTCSKANPTKFECDFCGKKLPTKALMRHHMVTHSIDRNFHCNKCDSGFKTKQSLLLHSSSKAINKCAVCDVEFPCRALLSRHRSEFHGNSLKCDRCSYETRYESHLKMHQGIHEKSIACETCDKKFAIDKSLKLHQMLHRHGIYSTAPELTFECEKCNKTFSNEQYFKQHQRQVHVKEEVKCEVCDKICKNQIYMQKHSRIHFKIDCSICNKKVTKQFMAHHVRMHSVENLFECDLCDHSTKSKKQLKHHIERIHLLKKLVNDSKCREDFRDFDLLAKLQLKIKYGSSATSSEKKFKCDKCSKAFVTSIILKRHKKMFHVEELVDCEICKKKVRPYQFKSHMKFHSKVKYFECDLCENQFKTRTHVERHVKERHRNGALICPIGCHEKFTSFDQIIQHRKIHIAIKVWKCMKCDFQAAGRRELFKHIAIIKHENKYGSSATSTEKKFKCNKCSKAFDTSSGLKQHKKKIHVDELVECQFCMKKVRPYLLNSHIKFHARGNPFECDLCENQFKTRTHVKRHVKERHRNGALICPIGCHEKFTSFDQIVEHRKIHIAIKVWKCTECELQATSRQQLINHKAIKKHEMMS